MHISQQITALRKEGNLDDAEKLASSAFEDNMDNKFFQSAYGWVIYFRLKNIPEDLQAKKITHGKSISLLNYYINLYVKFNLIDKPDLLHSMILMQVLKIDKDWDRLLGFAKWWGVDNFRQEDYKPLELQNGKKIASLNLRFYYRIGRALCSQYLSINDELREWAEEQLELILSQNKEDQWLRLYNCKLMLLKGDSEGALKSIKQIIKKKNQEFWAWSLLGDIITVNDSKKAILCYQHAINLSKIPTAVVNVREKLAKLLALQNKHPEAIVQIIKALELRKKLGSNKISNDLTQMINSNWYKEHLNTKLPKEIDVSNQVIDIIYADDDLVLKTGVVDNQNQTKKLAHVSFGPDNGVVLMHHQFSKISNVGIGAIINVFFEEGSHSPIRWKRADQSLIDGLLNEFTGILEQVPKKDFGFIRTTLKESIFVPPDLMYQMKDKVKSKVTCRAILALDKSKGKEGWKALCEIETICEF